MTTVCEKPTLAPKLLGVKVIHFDKTYDLAEMVAEKQRMLDKSSDKADRGAYISEAKLNIVVTNVDDSALAEYMARFMDYRVRKLDLSSWIYLPYEEFKFFGENVRIMKEIDHSTLKSAVRKATKEGLLFRTLWAQFRTIKLSRNGESLFDKIQSITLTRKETGHVITFGCTGDCQPRLQWSSNPFDYDEFAQFFHNKGAKVRISLCANVVRRRLKYKETIYVPTEEQYNSWTCY